MNLLKDSDILFILLSRLADYDDDNGDWDNMGPEIDANEYEVANDAIRNEGIQ